MTLQSTATARGAFHDQFGTAEKDIREYGGYCEEPERLSVGTDEVCMFVPDDIQLPLGIPVAEFDPVQSVTTGIGVGDGNVAPEGEQIDILVFQSDENSKGVVRNGKYNVEHVVQLKYVEQLARMEGVSVSDMCDRARIHTDYAHYPVMFPCETGRVLVAPFCGDIELYDE